MEGVAYSCEASHHEPCHGQDGFAPRHILAHQWSHAATFPVCFLGWTYWTFEQHHGRGSPFHPWVPTPLQSRIRSTLLCVLQAPWWRGGDFRQVFRQYFVEHDPDFFNEEHWDYMNVSLKGSCSAVAFTDLLITKVESPVARGEMLFGLRLIEEHLNCDLTSVRWYGYVFFPYVFMLPNSFCNRTCWLAPSFMLCCLQPQDFSLVQLLPVYGMSGT